MEILCLIYGCLLVSSVVELSVTADNFEQPIITEAGLDPVIITEEDLDTGNPVKQLTTAKKSAPDVGSLTSEDIAPSDEFLPTIRIPIDPAAEIYTPSPNVPQTFQQDSSSESSEFGEDSQTYIVIIAVCVSVLSLTIIVFSIAAALIIRRRTRRKAYLRVKHSSQTELAVHYVQNGAAEAAARDSAMEQLFQSLASMSPAGQNGYSSDDQCLSPAEGCVSELVSGKSKTYSRSLPSLKNLNAHEEALNCPFPNVPCKVTSKVKGRSRSFTEKTFTAIDVKRSKDSLRSRPKSNSERFKGSAVVALLSSGKRFEKKTDGKPKQHSTSAFPRLKLSILKGKLPKRNAPDGKEQVQLPPIVRHSEPTETGSSSSCVDVKHHSTSLSDFELPNVSPILQDIDPMLTTTLHANGHHPHSYVAEDSNLLNGDMQISQDAQLSDDDRAMTKVADDYLYAKKPSRNGKNLEPSEARSRLLPIASKGTPSVNSRHNSCHSNRSGSLNDLGRLELTIANMNHANSYCNV